MSNNKDTGKTHSELTEDELNHVSGGKPSAAKSSTAPKVSESLSLSYEQVKFEY